MRIHRAWWGEVGGCSVCVPEPISMSVISAERHRMMTAVAGIKKLPPLFHYLLLSVFMSLVVFGTAGFISNGFWDCLELSVCSLRSSFLHSCIWVKPFAFASLWLVQCPQQHWPCTTFCLFVLKDWVYSILTCLPILLPHIHQITFKWFASEAKQNHKYFKTIFFSTLRPFSGYEKSKWNLECRNYY